MCLLYNKSRIFENCKRMLNENNLLMITSWTKRETLFFDVSDNTAIAGIFVRRLPEEGQDALWTAACCCRHPLYKVPFGEYKAVQEAGSKLVPQNSSVMPFDKTPTLKMGNLLPNFSLACVSSRDTCPFIVFSCRVMPWLTSAFMILTIGSWWLL